MIHFVVSDLLIVVSCLITGLRLKSANKRAVNLRKWVVLSKIYTQTYGKKQVWVLLLCCIKGLDAAGGLNISNLNLS